MFLIRYEFALPEPCPKIHPALEKHATRYDSNRTINGLVMTLWDIARATSRSVINADELRDYMLAFLFLRYLSDSYERVAKKELGRDYPDSTAQIGNNGMSSLSIWYELNPDDVLEFEKQMRLKSHYVIQS